jgi:hypothetical protein
LLFLIGASFKKIIKNALTRAITIPTLKILVMELSSISFDCCNRSLKYGRYTEGTCVCTAFMTWEFVRVSGF